jgi:hypothetical protein
MRIAAVALASAALVLLPAVSASAATRDSGLVTITSGPKPKTTSTSATFTFKVNASYPVTFFCDLDGDKSSCTSPVTYNGLAVGVHTFTVTAYAVEIGLGAASWTWIVDSTSPNFVLQTNPAELPLATRVGFSSVKPAHVQIIRLGGSNGPVSIQSATTSGSAWIRQVAPGVTAKIVPNDASNPTVLTLSLTAQPWATAEVGKSFFFTVVPSSPAVGPVSRSIGIKYSVLDEYDLALRGIDITQGIQPDKPLPPGRTATYDGVKLVRDKRTRVRVFASVAFPTSWTIHNARIYLRGWRFKDGSTQESLGQPLISDLATINGGLDAPVSLEVRKKNPPSWTFTLPPSWTEAGTIALEAEVKPPTLYQPAATSECSSASCAVNNSYKLVGIPFIDTGYVNVWALHLKLRGVFDPCCNKDQFIDYLPSSALTAAGQLMPLADGGLRDFNDFRAEFDATARVKYAMTQPLFGCPAGCSLNPYLIGYSEDLEPHQVCPGTSNCPDVVMSMIDDTPLPKDPASGWPSPWYVNGVTTHKTTPSLLFGGSIPGTALVNVRRPLTSTAHELGHSLSLLHASWGCKGAANGQKGDLSWPDPFGYLHGVGLDVRDGKSVYDTNSTAGPNDSWTGWNPVFGPIFPSVKSPAKYWYDFMSYCANNGEFFDYPPRVDAGGNVPSPQQGSGFGNWKPEDAWISVRNWNALQAFFALLKSVHTAQLALEPLRRASAKDEATLRVYGFLDDEGRVVLTGIRPRAGQPSAATPSAYELVLRNRRGAELQRWPLTVTSSEGHGEAVTFLSADVPLTGVAPGALPPELAELQVESGGTVLARVQRSANAPTVRVLAPTAGESVGAARTTMVRWAATDRDPDATLQVAVDYSADDGKSFDTLYEGPNTGQAEVDSARLSASKQGRLRIRVSDGFDEAAAISDRFEAAGRPPSIQVLGPRRGERARADEALYLSASAYDDTGAFLGDSAFTWYDGPRPIARGRMGSAILATPGRHLLRVVARDRSGREGAAVIPVQILRTAADIVVSRAPAAVSPHAPRISLRVACTLPARLSVGESGGTPIRTICDPTPRPLTIRVRPGRGPLRVQLEAVAQGRVSRLTLVFRR